MKFLINVSCKYLASNFLLNFAESFFISVFRFSPIFAADRRRHENRRRRVLDGVRLSSKISGMNRKVEISGTSVILRRSHFYARDDPGRVLGQVRALTVRLFGGESETLVGSIENCKFDGVNLKYLFRKGLFTRS